MSTEIARRRLALFVFFFIPGVAIASWVTRTPAIRDRIDVSIAEMGLVLFGLSVGSMCGILLSGFLVGRLGTRPVSTLGMCLVVAALLVMALGVVVGQSAVVALGLGLFGFGMGTAEIAINIDGAAVEQITGRPLMHSLHGCFSLGTVCGAILGFGVTSIGLPVEWHLGLVAAAAVPAIAFFFRFIPPGTARTSGGAAGKTDTALVQDSYWRDPRLLCIGLIVLAVALAEGSANDWLPILMVDEHQYSQAAGSLVFLVFASAMTLGRFAGGYFLVRFGRVSVIRVSALLSATGLALVIFSQNSLLAGAAVVLWGLGTSLGFPVAISAAASSGPNSTGRVKAVTIGGYLAFLVGPPFLGLLGELYGLRGALVLVLGCVLLVVGIASSVRPPPKR